MLFPHTASQKGSLASLGSRRVGSAPCPRQAGGFFGAFLLEWVWCRCLTFRGGEGSGAGGGGRWAGSAAGPPGWNRGGATMLCCALAPPRQSRGVSQAGR